MKKAIVALSAIFLAAGLVSTGVAQSSSDEEGSSVNVSISQEVSVDLTPNSLEFIGNSPGTFNDTSNRDYQGVEVENVGSQNITNIWMDSTFPNQRPFGTGQASEYDAGNFIQIRPVAGVEGVVEPYDGGDSSDPQSGFHYLNRKEFNETNDLSYFTDLNNEGTGEWRYGRFREGDEEFFWAIEIDDSGNDDANLCDVDGDAQMRVGWNSKKEGVRGSTDFTDSSQYVSYDIASEAGDYGRVDDVDLRTDHGNKTYSVLTWCGDGTSPSKSNQTFTVRTRNNVDAGDHSDSTFPQQSGMSTTASATPYQLMNSSNSNQEYKELQPGEHFTVQTAISIPEGVAQGEVTAGTLTLKVNNQ